MTPYEYAYLAKVLGFLDLSYIWCGKDERGVDCSGTSTLAIYLASGHKLDLRAAYDTDKMWKEWRPVSAPRPGTVILYGTHPDDPDDMDHVMTVVNDEMCIGACGGGRTTLTPTPGACVKLKPLKTYRTSQIRGYRQIPPFVVP